MSVRGISIRIPPAYSALAGNVAESALTQYETAAGGNLKTWRAPGPIVATAVLWRNLEPTLVTDGDAKYAIPETGVITPNGAGFPYTPGELSNLTLSNLLQSCKDSYDSRQPGARSGPFRLKLNVFSQAEPKSAATGGQVGAVPPWLRSFAAQTLRNPTESVAQPVFVDLVGQETGSYYANTYVWDANVRILARRFLRRLALTLQIVPGPGPHSMGGESYAQQLSYAQLGFAASRVGAEAIAKDAAGVPGAVVNKIVGLTRDQGTGQFVMQSSIPHGFPTGAQITVAGATLVRSDGGNPEAANGTWTVLRVTSGSKAAEKAILVGSNAAGTWTYPQAQTGRYYAQGANGEDEQFNRDEWRANVLGLPRTLPGAEPGSGPNSRASVDAARRPLMQTAWADHLADQLSEFSAPTGIPVVWMGGDFYGDLVAGCKAIADTITIPAGADLRPGVTNLAPDWLWNGGRPPGGVEGLDFYAAGLDYFATDATDQILKPGVLYWAYAKDSPNLADFLARATVRGFPLFLQTKGPDGYTSAAFPLPGDPHDAYNLAVNQEGFGKLAAPTVETGTALLVQDSVYRSILERANWFEGALEGSDQDLAAADSFELGEQTALAVPKTGADSASLTEAAEQAPAVTRLTAADAFGVADAGSPGAAYATGDQAAVAEAGSRLAAYADTDTATVTDPLAASAAAAAGTDGGTLSESATLEAAVAGADAATQTDATGLGADLPTAGVDAGLLSEFAALSQTAEGGYGDMGVAYGEPGGTYGHLSGILAELQATDQGHLVEGSLTGAIALLAVLAAADSGTLADAALPLAVLVATDNHTLSEAFALLAEAATFDQALLVDAAALVAEYAAADSGAVSELAAAAGEMTGYDQALLADELAALDYAFGAADFAELLETAGLLVEKQDADTFRFTEPGGRRRDMTPKTADPIRTGRALHADDGLVLAGVSGSLIDEREWEDG